MRYQIVCNGNRVETHDEGTGGLRPLEFATREEADVHIESELEKLHATLRGPDEAKALHAETHANLYSVDEIFDQEDLDRIAAEKAAEEERVAAEIAEAQRQAAEVAAAVEAERLALAELGFPSFEDEATTGDVPTPAESTTASSDPTPDH